MSSDMYMGSSNSTPAKSTSSTTATQRTPIKYSVAIGNWTTYVKSHSNTTGNDYVKNFIVGSSGGGKIDPAFGCAKSFDSTYKCGNSQSSKSINISAEARGKNAKFNCTNENKKCNSYRLTVRDDGNLIFSSTSDGVIWESNTRGETGVPLDKYKAEKGKFKRNYMISGESLSEGEFIGSPSGNCYLLMTNNGLELSYDTYDCEISGNIGFSNSETANALYSIKKTDISKRGSSAFMTYGGDLHRSKKSLSKDLFFNLGNFDSVGNDIDVYSGLEKCKSECASNKKCGGFFIQNDGRCYLKNYSMFPNGLRTVSDNGQLYILSGRIGNNADEIEGFTSKNVPTNKGEEVTVNQWVNQKKVSSKIPMSEMDDAIRKTLDEIAQEQVNVDSSEKQLFEQIQKLRNTDIKLSTKLRETIASLETNLKNYAPTREKTQLIRNDMNNISGMMSDSELKMASENTRYLLWSIICLIVITFGIQTTRMQ